MDENTLTVLLAYNETNPELYIYKSDLEKSNLNFTPYFEIDHSTPMEEFDYMAKAIEAHGYKVITLNLNDNFQLLLETVRQAKPDVVFNCVEIIHGQARLEMTIAGLYELMEIPYTGAPPIALANCQNKLVTKKLLSAAGIQTPAYRVVYPGVSTSDINFPEYPLIVKPLFEDASVGIENASVVYSPDRLIERVAYVHNEFKQPALVEQFIEGRELNVAVFGDTSPVVLPISEIDFTEMPDHLENIVSYQAKWDPTHESYHKTIPVCPASLTDKQRFAAENIALEAFRVMGLRDYSRVDMRLSSDDQLYVLEVNPNPDLSEGAGFMRSAEAAGYTYGSMMHEIIQLALKRKKK